MYYNSTIQSSPLAATPVIKIIHRVFLIFCNDTYEILGVRVIEFWKDWNQGETNNLGFDKKGC